MEHEKPSRAEDEYFAKQELERKKQWEQDRAAKMQIDEKEKLKELHFMKCPKCGMDLHQLDLHGVKLDRCVSCNGTWFDAGEIEQVMASSDQGVFKKVLSVFR